MSLMTSDSGTDSSDSSESRKIKDEPQEEKVPMSSSTFLKQLPEQKLMVLNNTVENHKVNIRLRPIGAIAPIHPRVFKISTNQTISTISKFIIKRLGLKDDSVYMYVQNSFQPNPDEKIGDLYSSFKTNNELIISYCNTVAFG